LNYEYCRILVFDLFGFVFVPDEDGDFILWMGFGKDVKSVTADVARASCTIASLDIHYT
jgi:hypothetical protein